MVKVEDYGSGFFVQERIGLWGVSSKRYKFQSMRAGLERNGLRITIGVGSRITEIGRYLHRYTLDELPQLWNVLKREYESGCPRSEVSEYVNVYSELQQSMILSSRNRDYG